MHVVISVVMYHKCGKACNNILQPYGPCDMKGSKLNSIFRIHKNEKANKKWVYENLIKI